MQTLCVLNPGRAATESAVLTFRFSGDRRRRAHCWLGDIRGWGSCVHGSPKPGKHVWRYKEALALYSQNSQWRTVSSRLPPFCPPESAEKSGWATCFCEISVTNSHHSGTYFKNLQRIKQARALTRVGFAGEVPHSNMGRPVGCSVFKQHKEHRAGCRPHAAEAVCAQNVKKGTQASRHLHKRVHQLQPLGNGLHQNHSLAEKQTAILYLLTLQQNSFSPLQTVKSTCYLKLTRIVNFRAHSCSAQKLGMTP